MPKDTDPRQGPSADAHKQDRADRDTSRRDEANSVETFRTQDTRSSADYNDFDQGASFADQTLAQPVATTLGGSLSTGVGSLSTYNEKWEATWEEATAGTSENCMAGQEAAGITARMIVDRLLRNDDLDQGKRLSKLEVAKIAAKVVVGYRAVETIEGIAPQDFGGRVNLADEAGRAAAAEALETILNSVNIGEDWRIAAAQYVQYGGGVCVYELLGRYKLPSESKPIKLGDIVSHVFNSIKALDIPRVSSEVPDKPPAYGQDWNTLYDMCPINMENDVSEAARVVEEVLADLGIPSSRVRAALHAQKAEPAVLEYTSSYEGEGKEPDWKPKSKL